MELKPRGRLWITFVITLAVIKEGFCVVAITNPPSAVTTTEGTSFQIRCGVTTDGVIEGVRIKMMVDSSRYYEETIFQSFPADWVTKNFNYSKYSYEELGKLDILLTVKSALFCDGGLYTCEPIIDVSTRATAQVVVLGEPLPTLPIIYAGQPFTALCDVQFMAHEDVAEGYFHFPRLFAKLNADWLIGTTKYTGGELGQINSKLQLTVNTTLTESSDGENFTCIAKIDIPAGETRASQILDIKSEVTEQMFKCIPRGIADADIKWTTIQSSGGNYSNLTIIAEMIGDPPEVWQCEATDNQKPVPAPTKAQNKFAKKAQFQNKFAKNVRDKFAAGRNLQIVTKNQQMPHQWGLATHNPPKVGRKGPPGH